MSLGGSPIPLNPSALRSLSASVSGTTNPSTLRSRSFERNGPTGSLNPSALRAESFQGAHISPPDQSQPPEAVDTPDPTVGIGFLVFVLPGIPVGFPSGPDLIELSPKALSRISTRTVDGTFNNLKRPEMGSAGEPLRRIAAPQYGDGISSPAGADRPSPRVISNVISAQSESRPNERGLSSVVWQWGQFLDHDIGLTPEGEPAESFDIPIPKGDPYYDPEGAGTATLGLKRSQHDASSGTSISNPREQVSQITAWIDGSNVYGSDPERAAWLRTGFNGKLRTSPDELLPFNDGTQENAMGPSPSLFVAGDVRANEQVGLTAFHTLFVREHNRLAGEIKSEHPDWSDEQIYQHARRFVTGFMQAITYNEFLPALLGPDALSPYTGYEPATDATISNEFAHALYRLGHSMIPSLLLRLDPYGNEIPEGNLELRDGFFNPQKILAEGGIEPVLMGLASQQMEEVDTHVVDDLRNFLFGSPGSGGLDLVSLNIQRGRDHGLADYNTLREALGLPRAQSFYDITSDHRLATKLHRLYHSVDNIDPWVGALAEDHVPGASVGELLRTGLADQFERLRDGDRFWYENDPRLSRADVREIGNTTLADIIRRNTGIHHLQDNVFFAV